MRNLLLYGCVLGIVLFVALAMHPRQVSATQRDCGVESGRDCGQTPQSMTPTPNGVARAIAVVDVRVNPVARATPRVVVGAIPTVMVAITPTPMARTQAKVIGRAMIVPPASVTSLPSVTIPPVTTTPVPVTVVPPMAAAHCSLATNHHASGCNLIGADMSGRDLSDADFTGIDLHDADLSLGHVQRVNFTVANLTRVNFGYSVLDGSRFTNAILDGANLQNTSLIGISSGGLPAPTSCCHLIGNSAGATWWVQLPT